MRTLSIALAIAAATGGSTVMAEESSISFKGFGTFGIAHSDSELADFTSSNRTYVPTGAGRSHKSTFDVDSKIGAQLDWKIAPGFSATIQALSKQDYEDKFSPDVEWAFLKYAVSPELDLRAGRIRPALYLLSDFLDVNYANPWVRPPVEFYISAPINRMSGVDVLWRPSMGDMSFLVQPYIGTSEKNKAPGATEANFKNIIGINVTAQSGDFSYRFGYLHTKLTFTAPVVTQFFGADGKSGTLGTLCKLDAEACVQAAALYPSDKKGTFASLGVTYDNGELFASAEYGKRATDTYLTDGTGYYVSGGARYGQWTPYGTYSAWKTESPTVFTRPVTSAVIGQTNAVVTGLLTSNLMDQSTLSLGVRYDIAKNTAIKAQVDQISTKTKNGQAATGVGLFRNGVPTFNNRDNDVRVLTFTVDFVF